MDEILKRIKELKEEGYSYRQIGDKLGLHKDAVRSRYHRYKTRFDTKDVKEESLDSFNRTEDKNTLTINTKSTRIKTVEDALKYAEVDTNI
jgi:orotate phosphoribosyltransferase-like protein